jgi:exopolysaccharide biosynthesis polyprenyl glycosylphosphotransferase
MVKEKNKIVNNFLAFIDVVIAWVSLDITLFIQKGDLSFLFTKDSLILHFFLLFVWYVLSKVFRVSELYRSRPFSMLLLNCILLAFVGTSLLTLMIFSVEQKQIDIKLLLSFAGLDLFFTLSFKYILFLIFRNARKKGYNFRTVAIIGDKSAVPLVNKFLDNSYWGYKITALIGDEMKKDFGEKLNVLPTDSDIDRLLEEDTIDEVIYCYEMPDMQTVQNLLLSCNEVGVVFRMYSSIFNMLSNKTHLHFFGTTPLLTISNTPLDYLSLKAKRLFDFTSSLVAVTLLSPLYVFVALLIVFTSKGPVFFKQIRVGLRGRQFWLYKFRTMVTNAEELKEKLKAQNEMDGPVFKMTHDPRITKIGRFLRKTGIDELPQFFNVLMGDMSLVGPRPPVPQEVKEYERWQLRRLSMKPGITCIWQISENRNDISFEEWMRMDMEYIDNWSLKLDFVLMLKTVRAVFRADGR